METRMLKNGTRIPVIGFGTWQLQGDECVRAVASALEVGYRYIDTADRYKNHREVAQAINRSGIKREEIFLTTKVWWEKLKHDDVIESVHRFLEELNTPYLDLVLIHWPNRAIPLSETLPAFTELLESGAIKAMGVSNFTVHHLQDALKLGAPITNNQVEFHPSLSQPELKQFCDTQGIVMTAYSPLAQGHDAALPVVKELAAKYDKSETQVVLNWIISHGVVPIPRSSGRTHAADNFAATTWKLSPEDVARLDQENVGYRTLIPEFADFDY